MSGKISDSRDGICIILIASKATDLIPFAVIAYVKIALELKCSECSYWSENQSKRYSRTRSPALAKNC